MKKESGSVGFFYGNAFGRFLLKTVMKLHLDKVIVWFFWSRLSKPMAKRFVKKNNISVTKEEMDSFRSYRELFVRSRELKEFDRTPEHLISPCDSKLTALPILYIFTISQLLNIIKCID